MRSAQRVICFPGEEQSQYFLYVENESMCITYDYSLMLWFIVYYVLNLEYDRKDKDALFMQEFAFKLPATSGLKRQETATYLTVITDIQNCHIIL